MSEEEKEPVQNKQDYLFNDPAIHQIVMYYKDELKKNLEVALKPFKDKIKMPLEITIVLGEKNENKKD